MECPNCGTKLIKEPAQYGGLEEPSWEAYYECPDCDYRPPQSAAEIEDEEKADLNFN